MPWCRRFKYIPAIIGRSCSLVDSCSTIEAKMYTSLGVKPAALACALRLEVQNASYSFFMRLSNFCGVMSQYTSYVFGIKRQATEVLLKPNSFSAASSLKARSKVSESAPNCCAKRPAKSSIVCTTGITNSTTAWRPPRILRAKAKEPMLELKLAKNNQ